MKISWETCIYGGTVPVACAICAQRFLPLQVRPHQFVLAVLYDHQGQFHGEVCRECVRVGSTGIKDRLEERLTLLRQQVTELTGLAGEIIEIPPLESEFDWYRSLIDPD